MTPARSRLAAARLIACALSALGASACDAIILRVETAPTMMLDFILR